MPVLRRARSRAVEGGRVAIARLARSASPASCGRDGHVRDRVRWSVDERGHDRTDGRRDNDRDRDDDWPRRRELQVGQRLLRRAQLLRDWPERKVRRSSTTARSTRRAVHGFANVHGDALHTDVDAALRRGLPGRIAHGVIANVSEPVTDRTGSARPRRAPVTSCSSRSPKRRGSRPSRWTRRLSPGAEPQRRSSAGWDSPTP